jgi:single-stranded-DNA-specific exonuclease
MLAPRINAAGRMGKIELAIELFLTKDAERATYLAKALCDLNKQRQAVESEIYEQTVAMLRSQPIPEAIVLAGETWHQGVVGIVASRIAEEYSCPTFLICMDGDHGKASSRSYGGFNLFSALSTLSPLLESYGGHELAAGFTISRKNIDAFRREICALARDYYASMDQRTTLDLDCAITADLLTVAGIDSLNTLEPCGNGCPKPVLMMERLQVERISMVGGGRHMRLRLRQGRHGINAIYFSANPETASIQPGDLVDAAFLPQVNEFRKERTPQMNIQDLRPSCAAPCSADSAAYRALKAGTISAAEAAALLPDRATLAMVWRYLAAYAPAKETPMCLCRKIVRWTGLPLNLGQLLTCLDIFADVGLLRLQRRHKYIHIDLAAAGEKADLNNSHTMQQLLQAKES